MEPTVHKKNLKTLRDVAEAKRNHDGQVLRADSYEVLVATPQLNPNTNLALSKAEVVMEKKKVLNAWRQYGNEMRGDIGVGNVAIAKGFTFSQRYEERHKRNLEEFLATGTTTEWEAFLDHKALSDKEYRRVGSKERIPAYKYRHAVQAGKKILKDDEKRKPPDKRKDKYKKKTWRRHINNLKAQLTYTRATRAVTPSEALEDELAARSAQYLQGAQAVQHARLYFVQISRTLDFWPHGNTEQNDKYTGWRTELLALKEEFKNHPWMTDIRETPPAALRERPDGEPTTLLDDLKTLWKDISGEELAPPPVEQLHVYHVQACDQESMASDDDGCVDSLGG